MRIIRGTITNGVSLTGTDGVVLVGGKVTNDNSGVATAAIYADSSVTADIRNVGVIGNTTGTYFGIALEAAGRITNGSPTSTDALIMGHEFAIEAYADVTVTNYGTIEGSLSGVHGEVGGKVVNGSPTNSSALIAGENEGVGFAQAGTITNFGTIRSGVDGIDLAAGGQVTNGSASQTHSEITGAGSGIEFESGPATLTNFGAISCTSSYTAAVLVRGVTSLKITNGAGGSISGAYGIQSAVSGSITNFGTISGVGSYAADGIAIDIVGGTITNGSAASTTALLQGHFAGVYLEDTGRIVNFGRILGGVGAVFTAGGSLVNGSAADTTALIGNSLDGIDFLGAVAATVTNFGTISGSMSAVAFGDGGDLLSVGAAAVFVGAVTGGAGADTVTFLGGGEHAIGKFSGFETFRLASAVANTLALTNATFAGVTGATISVIGGGAGDTVGAASLAAANTLRFTGGKGGDTVTGGSGQDTLNGGGGADSLKGGNGADNLSGGLGADTLSGGGSRDRFNYLALSDSTVGAGKFDRITDFTAGAGGDIISLLHIAGATTIHGLITPASPSETPPASGLHAHSIAWYQVGGETVVIVNASGTANHVDMEIVLSGVTASHLSAASGTNFITGPAAPGATAAAFAQAIAADVGRGAAAALTSSPGHPALAGDHPSLIAGRSG